MDPKSLTHRQSPVPLGEQYWAMLRSFFTGTPAAANPWLQLFTVGRLVSLDAAPAYLTQAGFDRAKRTLSAVSWVKGDMLAFVRSGMPADIDKVCLSNLPDWLDATQFEQLMNDLTNTLSPGSRIVWCYLHVHRRLPPNLSGLVTICEDLGARLREEDRFPFYHIVPALIESRKM